MEQQMEGIEKIREFLDGFFSDGDYRYPLALKVFRTNVNLRLASVKEDARISAPHTATAHNIDSTRYIPVRDTRNPKIPLILKPITAGGATLAYIVVLDADKVASLEVCEDFARLYEQTALSNKKSFTAWASAHIARSSSDDRTNNARQKAVRTLAESAGLETA